MNLIDLLYGKNHDSAKGKLRLQNCAGEPVTVTKEIRYTVADGASNVHINGYEDLFGRAGQAASGYGTAHL